MHVPAYLLEGWKDMVAAPQLPLLIKKHIGTRFTCVGFLYAVKGLLLDAWALEDDHSYITCLYRQNVELLLICRACVL